MKVYLAGKITGDANYKNKFARAEAELINDGYIVLNPASLPEGLSKGEYMQICLKMIDVADAVVFLTDYADSKGALLEKSYCDYIEKKVLYAPKY